MVTGSGTGFAAQVGLLDSKDLPVAGAEQARRLLELTKKSKPPMVDSAMNEVRHSFRVMTYDIDFAGVVSNITYTRWLEDLRNLFAAQTLSVGDAFKRGIAPALTRTEMDFLAPVRFPDTVEARMWLDERGPAKWVLAAKFSSGTSGTVAVRAKQFGVFVSLQTLRPVPLPEEYR